MTVQLRGCEDFIIGVSKYNAVHLLTSRWLQITIKKEFKEMLATSELYY